MFNKLSLVAFALAAGQTLALQLSGPTNPTSQGTVTITWTAEASDPPTFSLQLTNEIFHDTFAIANNVPTASGKITLDLPELKPGDGYALIATQDANVNAVIGQSGGFSVGAATITSSSTTSGTATSVSSLASVQSISTSAFGSTVKASTTAPATSAAAATTSTTPNSAHETSFSILGMVAAVFLATGL